MPLGGYRGAVQVRINLVSAWSVVMHTYLDYFPLLLSLSLLSHTTCVMHISDFKAQAKNTMQLDASSDQSTLLLQPLLCY